MLSTRNSNLPSRTGDPAGAAVGVAGAAVGVAGADGAARGRLEVLLELDDELEVLSSLLPHFPTAKSRTKIPMTINATLPLKLVFVAVAVAVAVGAWGAAHP
jgi:hypothetical protein